MIVRTLRLCIVLSSLALAPLAFSMFKFEEEEDDAYSREVQNTLAKKDIWSIPYLAERVTTDELNMPDREGKTLLGYGIEVGNAAIVGRLLAEGADPNGETHRKSPLLFAVQISTHEVVDLLLLHGARDADSYDLFHEAIKRRSKTMINSLVRSGFDINTRAADGSFPLIDAALGKDQDVIETCLRLGADKEMRDGKGRTVLELLLELQKPAPGGRSYSENRLEKIGDSIVDDPGCMGRVSTREIIHFLQKVKSRWGEDNHELARIKDFASRLGSMPVEDALDVFTRLERPMQKNIALFVPLHLHARLKDSVRTSPSPASPDSFDSHSGECMIQ